MKRENELIIGLGEVGKSLQQVLDCDGYDFKGSAVKREKYEVLHICFPIDEKQQSFFQDVCMYALCFLPDHIVIHSTVPVGMTRAIRGYLRDELPKIVNNVTVTHSPIRGLHPHLTESIRHFVKYYGGPNAEEIAMRYEDEFEIPNFKCTFSSETTEALKLWSTTAFGWSIIFEKAVHDFCERNNVDFNIVYTHATQSYNAGYKVMGQAHFVRPVLDHMGGKIGGHCVISNAGMLEDTLARVLMAFNDTMYSRHVSEHSVKGLQMLWTAQEGVTELEEVKDDDDC